MMRCLIVLIVLVVATQAFFMAPQNNRFKLQNVFERIVDPADMEDPNFEAHLPNFMKTGTDTHVYIYIHIYMYINSYICVHVYLDTYM
jgi:hypothetical protein